MNQYQMKDVLKTELRKAQDEISKNGETEDLKILKEEIEYLLAWLIAFRGYKRQCDQFNSKLEANGFTYRMTPLN